jgi:Flp pilus assembly protein TadG
MSAQSLLRRLNREQRGQTILVFTLMFVALLGFTAMVTDAGVVYWNRRILQNAVDAAALAGASQLPDDPAGAIAKASTYASYNGLASGELITDCNAEPTFCVHVTKTYSDDDTLVVSARRHVDFGLRYIIGAGNTDVVATSAAIVSVQNPGNIAPWAISLQQLNTAASDGSTPTPCADAYTECSLKVGALLQSGGNFQAIQWDQATPGAGACPGGGSTCYIYSIEDGYPGPIATPVATTIGPDGTPVATWDWDVPTQPGNNADTQQALATVIAWDQAKDCDGGNPCGLFVTPEATLTSSGVNFYPDAQTVVNGQTVDVVCYQYVECPRVVVVPFISQSWTSTSGKTMVTIVNFGCFYITRYSGNPGLLEIDGMFIPTCKSTTGEAWYGLPLTPGGIIGNDIGVYLWR